MKRTITTTVIALGLATCLTAQVDRRERIQREILEKQKQMREGKIVRANVRVTVRLNNGSRLIGVVKDGRFVERPDEIAFVEADRNLPNAGLRLWYYDNTNSYIFLPYHSIKRYKIGEKLTDSEVSEIAKRIEEARKVAEKRRAEQMAKRKQQQPEEVPADAPGEPGPGGDVTIAKQDKPKQPEVGAGETRLTAAQRALLTEFPPSQGWSLDKLQSLERRKMTIGVFPNEKEAKFIKNFAAWNEAYEIWKREQEEPKPTPKPTPSPSPMPAPTPGTPGTPAPTPGK